jgi:hypothetical protein
LAGFVRRGGQEVTKKRREIAARLVRAYSGQADLLLAEVEGLVEAQTWPRERARER